MQAYREEVGFLLKLRRKKRRRLGNRSREEGDGERDQWDSRRGLKRHGVMLRGQGRSVKLYLGAPESVRSAFVPLMDPPPASAVPVQAPERIGAPGATRTPDLRVRSPTLYPTELRAPGAITTTSRSRLSRMGCEGLRKTRGAAGVQ